MSFVHPRGVNIRCGIVEVGSGGEGVAESYVADVFHASVDGCLTCDEVLCCCAYCDHREEQCSECFLDVSKCHNVCLLGCNRVSQHQSIFLIFVVGVKELEWGLVVVEDFLWTEETIKFDNRIFGRVAGVDDVFLERHTEVTTDGTWCSLACVG